MDKELIDLLANHALAAVFLTLYIRESMAHRATLEKGSETRRQENADQRQLIYRIARLTSGGAFESSTSIEIIKE